MFRSRPRTESPSRSSPTRGSVGSARVWDERTRALRAAGTPAEPEIEEPAALAPLELTALIASLVAATLDARMPDCEPPRRATLARELEERLFALLASPGGPAPEPVESAPAPSDEARAESVPSSSAPHGLGGRLEERLRALGGALAARTDLRARLVELALASCEPTLDPDDASHTELHALDVLQRRAHKLERSLADARAALAYVASLEHVEDGLASIYRTVQGLNGSDPQATRKREALVGIFRANLALQKPDESGPAPDLAR